MTAQERLIAGVENVGEWNHKGSYYTGSEMKGTIVAILETEMPGIIEEAEKRAIMDFLSWVEAHGRHVEYESPEKAFAAWKNGERK